MIHTRTKIVAVISFIFFVAALGSYMLFFNTVSSHKEELSKARIFAAEAEAERNALSSLETMVASSVESREKLRTFILEEEDIIGFLSLIERTGREQGVSITTDSITVGPINDIFEQLQVMLSVEGSFDGVMRMLRILEALPQQSTLPHVSLTRIEKQGMSWQAAIELHVTKFTKNEIK